MLVLVLSILLVSSSSDTDGSNREIGAGATTTVFFVGVGRGRDGRGRFAGGGEEDDGDKVVPLTTAAIVSEIAEKRKSIDSKDQINQNMLTIMFSLFVHDMIGLCICNNNRCC